MSRSYYAAIYKRKTYELIEVVRYHDDNMTSGEVKAVRDSDVKLYSHGDKLWTAVKAKDVPRLVRQLFGIERYERRNGYKIVFCEQFWGGSGWLCATVPTCICHG